VCVRVCRSRAWLRWAEYVEQQTLKGVFLLTRESVCRHGRGLGEWCQPVGVGCRGVMKNAIEWRRTEQSDGLCSDSSHHSKCVKTHLGCVSCCDALAPSPTTLAGSATLTFASLRPPTTSRLRPRRPWPVFSAADRSREIVVSSVNKHGV
jgi:hypothetical protein